MKELETAITQAFANIVASGAIEKAIQNNLEATITGAIENHLRQYSDFGKALSKHIGTALNVDMDSLKLPGYNDLILKIIRQNVETHADKMIAQQINEQMAALLAPPPAEIKLSALIEDFIKFAVERNFFDDHTPQRISLHVEKSSSGYHHIYFDKESGKARYECAYVLNSDNEGKLYSININNKDVSKQLFVGALHAFERALFQMYAAGTKLIVDGSADDIDTYYPGYDD